MDESRTDDGFVDMSAGGSDGPEGSETIAVDHEVALDLRPRGTAQILDFAVEILMKRVVPIVGVCALIWLPIRILMPFVNEAQASMLAGGSGVEGGVESSMVIVAAFLATALGQILASVASIATVTLFVYGDLVGRSVDVWDACRGALRRIFGLFGVMLVTGLAVGLTMGILVLLSFLCPIFFPVTFAVYFYLLWCLAVAPSSLVLEDLGVLEAIRRSWDLSKGSFWRWAGVTFLTYMLVMGVAAPVGILDEPMTRSWVAEQIGLPDAVVQIIFVVVGAVMAGLTTAFSAAAQTVYYLDLRMRRDGLDLLMRLERLNALG
jgi:hypothetical protein